MNTGLNSYKKTIFSQWGEDGIIEEIFKRIGETNRLCVEFGAGDGFECSNVWHLIKDRGWNALLMEPDEARYEKWMALKKEAPRLEVLKTAVAPEGDASLESILERNGAPRSLDLLSIDIDGDDYHIFKDMKAFKPRVLIIEHNPTIPPEDSIVQAYGEKEPFGASARANLDLAHEKGYSLAAMTHTNCIFVRSDEFAKLGIEEPGLEEVFDRSGLSYVVSAYNGSLYLRGLRGKGQPAFGWIYRGFRVSFFWSRIHAFAFGLAFKAKISATLARRYGAIVAFYSGKRHTQP
ncbi:MAG: FkbM family methyltransferase [Patescibacteria group bacterium]|nr:FkbM family methyltransferase [Patescibacteria group bacterium]